MKESTTVVHYANWVVRHPWIVILMTLLLVMAAASGGRLLVFNSDYRVFFSDDNPEMLAFEAVEGQYSKNDNVMFMLVPQGGNVFNQQTLEVVKILSEEAWQVPYSTRVDSLSNFQHTAASGDELVVRNLIGDETDLGDVAQRHKIRDIALTEPILLNRLVSQHAHVTGINVTVQLPGESSAEVLQVAAFARDLASKIEAQYPDINIRLSGMVFMNTAFSEASKQDMKSLFPLSFAVMMLILGLMTRSVSGTLSTLLVIISSIIASMGLGGYIGFPITPPSASSPIIILTIAIANCVHIIVTMLHEMRTGLDKKSAIVESLRINMQPVFITSITTTLGFLSMNFSDVPPFQHLGNMVAMGVVASYILAISLLPAVMCLLPVCVSATQNDENHFMYRFSDFVVRQRHKLVWGMTLTVLLLIAAIPRNELNDVFVHYFDQSTEFRQDADFMAENLTGLYVIDYSLNSGQPGNISDPQFLQEVDAFANWFRAQAETIHVNSITDIMRRLNKNMHSDDPYWYRLPQARELAAQYLLLYEMSLPYGLDLNNQINVDKSAIRFTATLQTLSSNELLALERRASEWLAANAPHVVNPGGSSTSLMFAHIGERNIMSMLMGTTLALIGISLLLIFALRSLKIGLISMIPNLVPVAMGFGLWGLLVGEVGLGLSIVAGMTLGIVVDDTVHLLSKYQRARREKNFGSEDAVRYALRHAGMALFTTSMALVCGFLVLALSSFQLNASMGLLTAIVIIFALLADFLLLLPLLMQYDKQQPELAVVVRSEPLRQLVPSPVGNRPC